MMLIQRLLALLILVSAGLVAAYGWKLMRDAVFSVVAQTATVYDGLSFLAGVVLFLCGLTFLGGFLFYRDKKRRRVQKRFLKTRRRDNGA
ncbi:MAG: DUF2627 domain-containing protein [Bacillota bacterium]|jgi:Protein of unknown function (DUF2627).